MRPEPPGTSQRNVKNRELPGENNLYSYQKKHYRLFGPFICSNFAVFINNPVFINTP